MLDSSNEVRTALLKRAAFLALAAAVCFASDARAQQVCYPPSFVTDGWKAVYVVPSNNSPNGGWYYLEPGAELSVRFNYVYLTYGYWKVVKTDAPSPSPSLSPIGEISIVRGASEVSATPIGGAAVGAHVMGAAPAGGGDARKFAVLDPTAIGSLAGFVPQGALTRLEADHREINETMLGWASERRLSPRSFEILRASVRRMERTLSMVVGRGLPRSGDDARRAEAVRTVTRLVENLEFVLPLLVEARLGARA